VVVFGQEWIRVRFFWSHAGDASPLR
jgi:hypothetical protein